MSLQRRQFLTGAAAAAGAASLGFPAIVKSQQTIKLKSAIDVEFG